MSYTNIQVCGNGGLTQAQIQALIDASIVNNTNIIPQLAVNPTSPNEGDIWFNTTNGEFTIFANGQVSTLDIKGDTIFEDLAGNMNDD